VRRFGWLYAFVLLGFGSSRAQSKLTIQLNWGSDPFLLNQNYYISKDTLVIYKLKFYISPVSHNCDRVTRVFLIDASFPESLVIPLDQKLNRNDSISFNIGIDSNLTQNTDWSGPLDPANGMYWAWNTGYINWKMEGRLSSSPEVHHGIYTHIGGYREGQKCEIRKTIPYRSENPTISVDMKWLLEAIIQRNYYNIQHPGKQEMDCSGLILKAIHE
jgi:hypothetical protein